MIDTTRVMLGNLQSIFLPEVSVRLFMCTCVIHGKENKINLHTGKVSKKVSPQPHN